MANIDVVISELGTPTPKWINVQAPRQLAHDLKAVGFDVVSVANNHSMGFRAEGVLDSLRALEETGVCHTGAVEELTAACTLPYGITLDIDRPFLIIMTNHLASQKLATEEKRWKPKS